jgi:4-amino-4-deoxy-L-arabinose transferase-like glycosyltransferase
MPRTDVSRLAWAACLGLLFLAFAHHTLPYLTTMPRVNVDEPWVMERAYQVLQTGQPRQPMLRLDRPYLLQPGYGYLLAPWFGLFGLGMFQARLFSVILGFVIIGCVAAIGRRLAGDGAGLLAAAYLLADSNFLGNIRMTRTDIPAVFFITLALLFVLVGRNKGQTAWFAASGVASAAAMLCHGNSFWVAIVIAVWYAIDNGRHMFTRPAGYAYVAGVIAGLAPYMVVVALNWDEVRTQIGNFAGDRVPAWRPSFIVQQLLLERERYRNWYFGLITNTVPNPLLWCLQAATAGGIVRLLVVASRPSDADSRRRALLLVTLALGTAAVFAGFINNKAHVYMPNLVIGFSLVAGAFTAWVAAIAADQWSRLRPGRPIRTGTVAAALALAYSAASTAYYQKWYSLTRRTELVPYESTARTIDRLVPAGPKYVFASPHFWVPFAGQPDVTFFSHAAPTPSVASEHMWHPWVADGRPVFLIVDERQWEPELTAPDHDPQVQHAWLAFIAGQCRLRAYAPGSAYGTLAAYECARDGPPAERPIAVVSDTASFRVGETVLDDGPEELEDWHPYADPRAAAAPTSLQPTADGVIVRGRRWPGVEKTLTLTAGEPYLLTAEASSRSPDDLVYIGQWSPQEVTSLSGSSSSGVVEPASRPAWFPGGHGFIPTNGQVRVLFYSESPDAQFTIRRVRVTHLKRPL